MTDLPNPDATAALRALGQALRNGREQKGLALPELANRLNMGLEQLRALENGDSERLPEPVFVVAQARRVAANLGINVDEPLQQVRETERFRANPLRVEGLNLSGNATGNNGARQVANDLADTTPRHRPNPSRSVTLPLCAAAAIALAAGIVAALVAGGRQPAPRAAPTATGNELLLSSSKPSWLEVKASTGAVLFRGTFQGERRFPLNGGLAVLAGRPDLVKVQIGSGASAPLGRIDQVSWKRFKPAAAAPAPAP